MTLSHQSLFLGYESVCVVRFHRVTTMYTQIGFLVQLFLSPCIHHTYATSLNISCCNSCRAINAQERLHPLHNYHFSPSMVNYLLPTCYLSSASPQSISLLSLLPSLTPYYLFFTVHSPFLLSESHPSTPISSLFPLFSPSFPLFPLFSTLSPLSPQAFMLPNVMNYAVAFGFFKLVSSATPRPSHIPTPFLKMRGEIHVPPVSILICR